MHPEIRQSEPGSCPKCGMALEPVNMAQAALRTEYTCPMHPEIVRDRPGNCPICGMALQPRTFGSDVEENSELADMRRRFWISVALSVPILISAMGEAIRGLGEVASPEDPDVFGSDSRHAGCSLGTRSLLRQTMAVSRESQPGPPNVFKFPKDDVVAETLTC